MEKGTSEKFLVILLMGIFSCFTGVFAQYPRLTIDALGNYWHISKKGVQKLNSQGKILRHYSNVILGEPTFIDPSDPFKIMAFYYQSQQLLFLNNDAAAIGKTVNLYDLGLGEVVMACRSALGGVWLYHRETGELLRYNSRLDFVEQRISLDQRFIKHNSLCMCESGGILYVGVDHGAIARFDTYGAQLIPLKIPNEGFFRIETNYLWVQNRGVYYRYFLQTPEAEPEIFNCPCSDLPLSIDKRVVCFDGREFVFCEKSLP